MSGEKLVKCAVAAAAVLQCLLVVCAVPSAHGALEVPPASGTVVDLDGSLTPGERKSIEETIRKIAAGGGPKMAVLTLPALAGEVIEDYSARVAEKWLMGGARGEGIVLVLCFSQRIMHFEISAGLRGRLPDEKVAAILNQVMVPMLRRGEREAGIRAGLEALAEHLKSR